MTRRFGMGLVVAVALTATGAWAADTWDSSDVPDNTRSTIFATHWSKSGPEGASNVEIVADASTR